ncbi:MAG: hypothetical protein WCO38_09525 [Verrucomicrobiota bacterium]
MATPTTLADLLRAGYTPPTESALADPIKEHFRTLPQQIETNQQAMDKTMGGMYKTDPLGRPNPNYYPEAMQEFTQMMPMVGALTAWHGTPHKILNKFDISKVGTGEGNQSFGHGMYFAENPKVASQYAVPNDEIVPKAIVNNIRQIYDQRVKTGGSTKEAINEARNQMQYMAENAPTPTVKQLYYDGVNNVERIVNKPLGNMYKVDIPDERIPMMLDYDKPIKDQPDIYNLVKSRFTDPDLLKTFENNAANGISGANVYKNYLGGKTDKERSENALALGIQGIRYKDALSRNTDEGTSNFVVFDPSTVKILEENSKPLTRKEILEQELKKRVE